MRDRHHPLLRAAVALINAAAILMLCGWGVATNEWYLRASGGEATLHEIATWVLIALNAPAFLLSTVLISTIHLSLMTEFIVQHVVWALTTVPAWWILWRLRSSGGRSARRVAAGFITLALLAAAWTTRLALLQAHDPHHSCWQALELPIMLAALAVIAGIVGWRAPDLPMQNAAA